MISRKPRRKQTKNFARQQKLGKLDKEIGNNNNPTQYTFQENHEENTN